MVFAVRENGRSLAFKVLLLALAHSLAVLDFLPQETRPVFPGNAIRNFTFHCAQHGEDCRGPEIFLSAAKSSAPRKERGDGGALSGSSLVRPLVRLMWDAPSPPPYCCFSAADAAKILSHERMSLVLMRT